MFQSRSTGYGQLAASVKTQRAIEYDIIARVTQNLSICSNERKNKYVPYIEALTTNERLWSTLAADIVENGNGLPKSLKGQLFYLFKFTHEHTKKLRADTSIGADALIDINTAILKGLRGDGGGQQ